MSDVLMNEWIGGSRSISRSIFSVDGEITSVNLVACSDVVMPLMVSLALFKEVRYLSLGPQEYELVFVMDGSYRGWVGQTLHELIRVQESFIRLAADTAAEIPSRWQHPTLVVQYGACLDGEQIQVFTDPHGRIRSGLMWLNASTI